VKEGKVFFFEKKKQKAFSHWRLLAGHPASNRTT
jgi:hypothetical protein